MRAVPRPFPSPESTQVSEPLAVPVTAGGASFRSVVMQAIEVARALGTPSSAECRDVTSCVWITLRASSTTYRADYFLSTRGAWGRSPQVSRLCLGWAAKIHTAPPSQSTDKTACLHRLSTGLCTARLDAAPRRVLGDSDTARISPL